jgi:predicted nucleotidyltransferase
MPVRSLNSPVLKWPDAHTVHRAVLQWAERLGEARADLLRIGYFGSYARGDWGVGSDLDLVIIVESSEQPFERRAVEWDANELPVPADVLIYTQAEWESCRQERGFVQTMSHEVIWVYPQEKASSSHNDDC